jgi:hypothetical protein
MQPYPSQGASVGISPVSSQAPGFATLLVLVRLRSIQSEMVETEKGGTMFVARSVEGSLWEKLNE